MTLELTSEFAAVSVELDLNGNGPRLKLVDRRSGRTAFLDPLTVESIAWATPDQLGTILDPGSGRWGDPEPRPGRNVIVLSGTGNGNH